MSLRRSQRTASHFASMRLALHFTVMPRRRTEFLRAHLRLDSSYTRYEAYVGEQPFLDYVMQHEGKIVVFIYGYCPTYNRRGLMRPDDEEWGYGQWVTTFKWNSTHDMRGPVELMTSGHSIFLSTGATKEFDPSGLMMEDGDVLV